MTKLFDEHGAAEYLQSTPRRVKQWAREGKIPHVPLPNGDIRFRLEDLKDYAEQNAVPAKSEDEQ